MLPYYPGSEVSGEEKEISDEEYVEMLNEYYSRDYFRYMDNAINGIMDSRYGIQEVIPDQYKIETVGHKMVEPSYHSFISELNNIDDEPLSYNDIVQNCNNPEPVGFIFHIYIDNNPSAADSISELSQWVRESQQILRDPHIDDEKRLKVLPIKDLIISCENEQNGVIYEEEFVFNGSVIIDLDNRTNFAVAVNKITRN